MNKPKITHTGEHDNEGDVPDVYEKSNGQLSSYAILTEDERAKGFVRPVRNEYMHKGERPKNTTRPLTDEEKERHGDDYAVFEPYSDAEATGKVGRFWTNAQLSSGCGCVTVMSRVIAETLARDPTFYSAGFCMGCGKHVPNSELVWDGTDEVVGS